MDLTVYAGKCFEPITEEIYDQMQFISMIVSKYMRDKHAGVHQHVIKAVTYDCFMHYLEVHLHDQAAWTLEEKPEVSDIHEWAENSYSELLEDLN